MKWDAKRLQVLLVIKKKKKRGLVEQGVFSPIMCFPLKLNEYDKWVSDSLVIQMIILKKIKLKLKNPSQPIIFIKFAINETL